MNLTEVITQEYVDAICNKYNINKPADKNILYNIYIKEFKKELKLTYELFKKE